MIEAQNKNALIRMFRVHKKYGAKNAIVDITLDIAKNEFLFITGPSGAGKSTLISLLNGTRLPDAGQVA